jgi:hypothetical protein
MKNEFSKQRLTENPYEIWISSDGKWTWRVLKKYQIDDNKPFARWFCAVKSPYTFGSFDLGDVYVQEIKQNARKMTEEEMEQELKVCHYCTIL